MAAGEVCENCRIDIGEGQRSHAWDQGTVCEICYSRLMQMKRATLKPTASGRRKMIVFTSIFVAGGVAMIVAAVLFFRAGEVAVRERNRKLTKTVLDLRVLRAA